MTGNDTDKNPVINPIVPLKNQSLFWLLEISTTQHKCRKEVEKRGWTVEGGSRPPKTLEALQPISRKVKKNRLSMRTDLHNK